MDGLCLKTGIHGLAPPIAVGGGPVEVRAAAVSAVARDKSSSSASAAAGGGSSQKSAPSRFSFRYPLQSLWPGRGGKSGYNGLALDDAVLVESNGETRSGGGGGREDVGLSGEGMEEQNGNWVLKILHVRSLWKEEKEGGSNGEELENESDGVASVKDEEEEDEDGEEEEEEEVVGCDACRVDYDDEEMKFDRESFSRLLKKVSLAEAKLYAQLSYLGNLAYCIPKMKAGNLLKNRGFRFVTSSVDKRELAMKAEKNQVSSEGQEAETKISKVEVEGKERNKNKGNGISASAAYGIAASAASYLHSQTKSILPFKSSRAEDGKDLPDGGNRNSIENVSLMDTDVVSLMATTDSVTAVVAAKEEVKQAVADGLNSTRSSPCEWYICDDDQGTRFFVIQGSETLASWQANLLFEPVEFEGLDVLVHRGIYEAAKGMYEQMLPEVRAHLKSHGKHATFRFTGHSLGGSLSLLINLMLLVRGEVPASSLLPVVTFGAPSIMCGGDSLLQKLGLPRGHVQSITMHRDIVPRAFSCSYPNHVAELLKAVNGNFRNHPCLNNQRLLYAPMGEILILQPDEKFSPQHHLLPSGSGLYFLSCPLSETEEAEKQLRAAQTVFFNSPHPLEILSDRSAYGSEGTIQRDHDMNSYLKCVRNVIRQELNRVRKSRRQHRRKFWWSLLSPRGNGGGVLVGSPVASLNMGQGQFNFSGVIQTGRESFKRFSRLVASQHMHLLVVMLLPARILLLGAQNVIKFH
ncbi:hypothetical protein Tsubulata_004245 [Turnera subulata]|uniref:Fungal lipase-type domain-containing protein n=1 Tax=Turnera subulata TaxID=218843 RepID=A0A9Q0JEV9_9ROSI|nr:hypothetical protein Tsubulata_004245 [Turnera subulata]